MTAKLTITVEERVEKSENHLVQDFKRELNPSQYEAVTTIEGPVLYVAVTRAKDELFLSFANKSGSTERSINRPSRFLEPSNVKRTLQELITRSTVKAVSRNSKYRRYGKR